MIALERAEFAALAEPLIKWLCENMHPNATIIITQTSAELVEDVLAHRTLEYLKD